LELLLELAVLVNDLGVINLQLLQRQRVLLELLVARGELVDLCLALLLVRSVLLPRLAELLGIFLQLLLQLLDEALFFRVFRELRDSDDLSQRARLPGLQRLQSAVQLLRLASFLLQFGLRS